jgi:hypothetical protein
VRVVWHCFFHPRWRLQLRTIPFFNLFIYIHSRRGHALADHTERKVASGNGNGAGTEVTGDRNPKKIVGE